MCGNHLINTLAAFVFIPSVLGENIPTTEFGMISAETACWDIGAKFFMKTFTCRSTFLYAFHDGDSVNRILSSSCFMNYFDGFIPAGLGFVAVVVGQPGGAGAALRPVGRRPIQTVGRPIQTVGRPNRTCSVGEQRAIVIGRPKGRPELRNLYSYVWPPISLRK